MKEWSTVPDFEKEPVLTGCTNNTYFPFLLIWEILEVDCSGM
ncbi:hypothetical protein V7138_13170 [Bacillus sp. JJ1533]